MNKKNGCTNRLGIQLALTSFVAAAVSICLFLLLARAAGNFLDGYVFSPQRMKLREQQSMVRFQDYVSKNQLSSSDGQTIDNWPGAPMFLMIYRGTKILHVNNKSLYADAVKKMSQYGPPDDKQAYPINFTDGPAQVMVMSYYGTAYYRVADVLSMFLATIVFLIILFSFIRRKMNYILTLKQEMQILKEGDLDCNITISGNDELTFLALEMDAMRRSLKEQQQREAKARRANKDLVTAMSHDLRTPLTALLGYVDILNLHRCQEDQKGKYLAAVRDKALQIKSMSDQLFEYFIVYGRERDELELSLVNAEELIGQIVEESLFDLESEGIQVERCQGQIDCLLEVDVKFIRRVFDNLFSNLLKYADRAQPVKVSYGRQDQWLKVSFVNSIRTEQTKRESTKLGLSTCQKIMKEHGGSFLAAKENEMFRVELCFQVKEP